jgi:V/A-type H+/Na+-transporting ATPase subunit I
VLFTERMKKIEMLIMKKDVDSVMRYLSFAGCLQLIAEGHEQRELSAEEREIVDLKLKVESVARFFGREEEVAAEDSASDAPDRARLRSRALALLEDTRGLIEEETLLLQRRVSLQQASEELSAFSHLRVPFRDLENLTYLTVRLGFLEPQKVEELSRALAKRALVLRLNAPGHILAVAPRKGRWALDSELRRRDFQERPLPAGMKGVPADMLKALSSDLNGVEASLASLKDRKEAVGRSKAEEIGWLLEHLRLDAAIDSVTQGLASSGSVQKVSGWIPRRKHQEVVRSLDELTHGSIALRSFDPEELADVKSGKTKVPVSTPHGRIVRGFERMVFSYSIPLYGTIDPTPFVAVMFVLLFAIMFGDVGQGSVGLLLGLAINSGRIKSFEGYRRKNFGTVFIVTGLASVVAGFLYGSFFASEEFLVPVSRALSLVLLGRAQDHIISLGGFQKVIMFFGVTIGIGAVINSVGLVINIANYTRRRDWEKALLSKTGLAGALFFWYVLFIGVRIILGGHISVIDFACLAVPLLGLFFREAIVHLATGHRPVLKDGLFGFIMEGIVEILESVIYYVSNSVSFLRVAAFALAHTVLSTIVLLLADMVGGAPGGIAFRILVILIGNGIIIVLEGLIVTIQVVRLQYYEFFSKFFNETGEEFTPFSLRTSGGLR